MTNLENYFNKIKENIIRSSLAFEASYREIALVSADWTASGRIYIAIQDLLTNNIASYVNKLN